MLLHTTPGWAKYLNQFSQPPSGLLGGTTWDYSDQSEANTQVTWSGVTNQKQVLFLAINIPSSAQHFIRNTPYTISWCWKKTYWCICFKGDWEIIHVMGLLSCCKNWAKIATKPICNKWITYQSLFQMLPVDCTARGGQPAAQILSNSPVKCWTN